MDSPKEGQKVMADFYYGGSLSQSPATYTQGKFIVSFYSANIVVDPVSWTDIDDWKKSMVSITEEA